MARELEHWTDWFGGREEYVLEAPTEDGDVVIRGHPDARIVTIFKVPWCIDVRRKSDDPFGRPIWVLRAADQDEGYAVADDLFRRLLHGDVPWRR